MRIMEVIEADLTWIGNRFEHGVKIVIEDGAITRVVRAEDGDTALPPTTRLLENQALLPGFVNCHSHAFQRGLRGRGETYSAGDVSSFWTWREDMYKLVEGLDSVSEFKNVTRQCFEEMRSSGITTVGEFHYFHHAGQDGGDGSYAFDEAVLQAADEAGIRIVLLSAFYKHAGFEGQPLAQAQRRFETASVEEYFRQIDRLGSQLKKDTCNRTKSLGVVAHSLRAVSVAELSELHRGSVERCMPFHLHIEEQPLEVEQCLAVHRKTPMELLLETIAVDCRTTAVHCNHTRPDQLRTFAAAGGNVCICPLTEGNLGDGVMADLSACGQNLCIGTDCNARICFLEEMRWLEYSQRLARLRRGVVVDAMAGQNGRANAGERLLCLSTKCGARALGLPVGAIEPGLRADFVSIDLGAPALAGVVKADLAAAIVFGASSQQLVKSTCVDGCWRENQQGAGDTSVLFQGKRPRNS